ncbi:pentapeptide repeat-containing protein [Gymnodinialimonas hymeniacidonis]|uniref:pentapeptide repeat-containing protein n=1 Tax=Gymnodinialimonas hymeniacidonis TaxID=3126508 RepID=UPI0034C5EB7E
MAEPDPIHRVQIEDDHVDAQINRINELTRVGRTNWFGLLAYLAFATVTVLGVEDADFFLDTRQTTLPLIGVSIPTLSFFIFAPILGAALYVYLHLHIRKMGAAIHAPNPFPKRDDVRLEHYLNSWLLVDLLLKMRGDGAIEDRPLDWGVKWLTLGLVWWAAPLVLVLFWYHSWVAHQWVLTLGIVGLTTLSGLAGIVSWISVRSALGSQLRAERDSLVYAVGFAPIMIACALLGMVKTHWGMVRDFSNPVVLPSDATAQIWLDSTFSSFLFLETANLQNLQTIDLPANQRDYAVARRQYRIEWCGRVNLEMSECGPDVEWAGARPSSVVSAREDWCSTHRADLQGLDCEQHFANLEAEFFTLWESYRADQILSLGPPNLANRDLRNADLRGAQLFGAVLTNANLQGADLSEAQLQTAQMNSVQLQGARLSGANLQEANMVLANLSGANLNDASLQRANLGAAQGAGGTTFRNANFQGARMFGARFLGQDFIDAEFQGARLHESDLRYANLSNSQFQDTQLFGVRLHGAQLTRISLSQGTRIADAELQGAAISEISEAEIEWIDDHWNDVIVFNEVLAERAPDHWIVMEGRFTNEDFITQWRDWAATLDPPVTIAPDYRP